MPTSCVAARLSRLMIVVVLFFGMCAPAVAGQIDPDGIKDRQGADDAESTPDVLPGLVDEGEFVSPVFDVEVTWTDAWELGDLENPLVEFAIGGNFDAAVTSDPASGDAIWLMDTASESAVLGVFIVPNPGFTPTTMTQVMGQPDFLEDSLFVSPESDTLLLEETDTTATILVRDADTPEHLVYLEVVFPEDENYFIWAGFDLWEPDAYEGVFEDVAEGIEISGVDLFSVATPDELLELINEPASDDDDATPEADVTPEDDATDEADETPEADATDEADETPQADATEEADETPEADTDFPGLVAEGEYESPQYGTGITWTDAWIVDESRDEPIFSNEDDRIDTVFLTDAATESTIIYMTVEELSSSDPEDILDLITREGYNEEVFGIDPDSEVLLADSTADSAAILVVDDSGVDPLVILMEVHALNDEGLVAFVDFRAYASDIDEEVLTALEQDLEIEGRPGLTVFTVDEVLAELEGL